MKYPLIEASRGTGASTHKPFDMRRFLTPRRLTLAMWDFAFLTRHMAGDAFADYDRVLDEAVERGYNAIRIDPLPHVIDLTRPEALITRPKLERARFNPWDREAAVSGPLGAWLIDFMEKLLDRGLYYCLSAWSPALDQGTQPQNLQEVTDCFLRLLEAWRGRFGFDRCLYVDLSNEYPYFLNDHLQRIADAHGERWSPAWCAFVSGEVNGVLRAARSAFPEVRFMVSLHDETPWINLGLELDVMDIHFYATADPRYLQRSNFGQYYERAFYDDSVYKDLSDRSVKSHRIMAPMYRARQRTKIAAFSRWSQECGIPLLTTESWANWFWIDHPDMDWGWLLDWAEWSVEDAIDYGMWGWTPHNYCQPQFQNWQDVAWHRRLTDKFLHS